MYLQETDSEEKIGLLKNEKRELETQTKQREICSTVHFALVFTDLQGDKEYLRIETIALF